MKLRAKKHFKKLIKLGHTITVRLFMVSQKKDDKLVKIMESKTAAKTIIAKAKAGKKAALYISGSYSQKYTRA